MIPFTKLDVAGFAFGCFGTGRAFGFAMSWFIIYLLLHL